MTRILIATDKFKGSLSADEVCEAVRHSLLEHHSGLEVVAIPLADGGEGSLEALARDGDRRVTCRVADPLGRAVEASYVVRTDGVAIVEMAVSVGLARLAAEERNPEKCSSYGFGEVIAHAYHQSGAREFILTIGGSATSDCGVGMLAALGLTFQDAEGVLLEPVGASVGRIAKIGYSKEFGLFRQCRFTVVTDVDNPLLGENGAARVYAPQKGADEAMVERLEQGASRFVHLINKERCQDVGLIPGGGAAGGVGMALSVLLGAHLLSGADFILRYKEVESFVEWCDVVLTGEGSVDRQTLNGKLVSRVLALARKHGKRSIVLCGVAADGVTARTLRADALYSLVGEGFSKEVAMTQAAAIINQIMHVHGVGGSDSGV